MKIGLKLLLLFGVSSLLDTRSTVAQVPAVDKPVGEMTQVRLPESFDAILRAYEKGWSQRDEQALANLFAEDGFVLRPGHPPVRGRNAIKDAYANSGGPLVLRAYDYGLEENIGYIIGGFARQPKDPDAGKYVLVLKKSDSGEWLIAADMDNGNTR